MNPVLPVGERVAFSCHTFPCSAFTIEWWVNGTRFNSLHLPDLVQDFSSNGIGRLHFDNIAKYNQTRIQCVATTFVGGAQSDISVLLVQGSNIFEQQ